MPKIMTSQHAPLRAWVLDPKTLYLSSIENPYDPHSHDGVKSLVDRVISAIQSTEVQFELKRLLMLRKVHTIVKVTCILICVVFLCIISFGQIDIGVLPLPLAFSLILVVLLVLGVSQEVLILKMLSVKETNILKRSVEPILEEWNGHNALEYRAIFKPAKYQSVKNFQRSTTWLRVPAEISFERKTLFDIV